MVESQAFYVKLGSRIRAVRENSGLTQEVLASLVSLTRTSVTNIEKGRQKILVHTLVDIAAALKVAPEALLPQNQFSGATEIDELIKENPPNEWDWIKAVVDSASEE